MNSEKPLAATIRAANVEEIPEIQRVGIEAETRFTQFGHPELADGATIPTAVAKKAITRGSLLVAELRHAIVGWVYTARLDDELCIGQISVLPEFGRSGIGTALLRHVIDDTRGCGEPSIVLNTQSDVPWGRPWYERQGFMVVPREEWSAAFQKITDAQTADGLDWSTRVHMRLQLDKA